MLPRTATIDPENALRIYYSHTELGNREIAELLGGVSKPTVERLKKRVRAAMTEQNVKTCRMTTVSARLFFEIYGLDVEQMERNLQKLRKLKLDKGGGTE
jgi:hypothetical protein